MCAGHVVCAHVCRACGVCVHVCARYVVCVCMCAGYVVCVCRCVLGTRCVCACVCVQARLCLHERVAGWGGAQGTVPRWGERLARGRRATAELAEWDEWRWSPSVRHPVPPAASRGVTSLRRAALRAEPQCLASSCLRHRHSVWLLTPLCRAQPQGPSAAWPSPAPRGSVTAVWVPGPRRWVGQNRRVGGSLGQGWPGQFTQHQRDQPACTPGRPPSSGRGHPHLPRAQAGKAGSPCGWVPAGPPCHCLRAEGHRPLGHRPQRVR